MLNGNEVNYMAHRNVILLNLTQIERIEKRRHGESQSTEMLIAMRIV
jgi:hypothetical protein